MRELSRLNLYSNIINHEINSTNNLPHELLQIYTTNVTLLKKIEPLFYSIETENFDSEIEHFDNRSSEIEHFDIRSILEQNFEELDLMDESHLLLKGNLDKELLKQRRPKNQFNKLLNTLIGWSDMLLKDSEEIYTYVRNHIQTLPKKGMHRVFLSYAYEDNLYTLALFYFFYSKGIYLYVDWMHNKAIFNGGKLKSLLFAEMKECDQLLLMQSVNTELNLSGNPGIKPWSAWEVGNFYHKKNGLNKYYLSLYNQSPSKQHLILDGMNKLNSIDYGYLK